VKRRNVWIVIVAVLAALSSTFAMAGPAGSVTGDTTSTIVADRTGTTCVPNTGEPANGDIRGDPFGFNYWTGIAFDGTSLILSCHEDPILTFVNPTSGAQVKLLTTTGTTDLGALAYDKGRGMLWACNNGDVGLVDLATGTYTKVFTASDDCLDGLAYDGSDDTIWASGDAQSSIQHYSSTGSPLGSMDLSGKLGNCGNSGIAVGGANLYLANNGCSEIYEATKDLATSTLFIGTDKTGNRRVEDLECDNVTFASQGKTVIWSQDAYDNILTAYEIPAGVCGFGGAPPAPPAPPVEGPAAEPVAVTPNFTG